MERRRALGESPLGRPVRRSRVSGRGNGRRRPRTHVADLGGDRVGRDGDAHRSPARSPPRSSERHDRRSSFDSVQSNRKKGPDATLELDDAEALLDKLGPLPPGLAKPGSGAGRRRARSKQLNVLNEAKASNLDDDDDDDDDDDTFTVASHATSVLEARGQVFDSQLRKLIISEMRLGKALDHGMTQARKAIPMRLLFNTDIDNCRRRMKQAVVDVVVSLHRAAQRRALRKWRRWIKHQVEQEERDAAALEERIKKADAVESLNRLAKRAKQGKWRVMFFHWREVTALARDNERLAAQHLLHRVARGFLGRIRAKKRRNRLAEQRRRALNALCGSALLERRGKLLKMYRRDVKAIDKERSDAAATLQGLWRRHRAQKRVNALRARKRHELIRLGAAAVLLRFSRYVIAMGRVQRRRDRRAKRKHKLRMRLRTRSKAVALIQRWMRGRHGRRIAREKRVERRDQDWAARKMQKAWRVFRGNYALSIKLAARRERAAAERAVMRNQAATMAQSCYRRHRAKRMLAERRAAAARRLEIETLAAQGIQIWWYKIQGKIELAMRCAKERHLAEMERINATKLQSMWRGFKWRRIVRLKRRRIKAAIIIQRDVRVHLARRKLFKLRLRRQMRLDRAATKIQCMARKRFAIRTMQMRRIFVNATRIACFYRCYRARLHLKAHKSSLRIQCFVRCIQARWHLRRRISCLRIQTWARTRLAVISYRALLKQAKKIHAARLLAKKSATTIQRVQRGRRGRAKALRKRQEKSALQIQTYVTRPALARRSAARKESMRARMLGRRQAETSWALLSRKKAATIIQRSVRRLAARLLIRRLRRERRERAASVIQRLARMFLARMMVARAKANRAAGRIQEFWRRDVLEYRALLERFKARRDFLDAQLAATELVQRVWRASRSKKRFNRLIKAEKDRKIKEDYLLERRNLAEAEKRRIKRREQISERRRVTGALLREMAEAKVIKDGEVEQLMYNFRDPGWAKNLPDLDFLERVFFYDAMEKRAEAAWEEVPVEEGSPEVYYFNSETGESQWDKPLVIAERDEKLEREARIAARETRMVEEKRLLAQSRPYTELRCKNRIDWVAQFAVCNQPATIYCAHCNLVFCEACNGRNHSKGITRNHFRFEIATLANNDVCVACREQLVNFVCETCGGEGYCESCWVKTHVKCSLDHHKYTEVLRSDLKPKLSYGDQACPSCNLVAATRNCTHCVDVFCDACYDTFHEKGRRALHEWTPANEYSVWKKFYDVGSDRHYYVNSFTSETTWTKPAVLEELEANEGRPGAAPKTGRTRDGKIDLRSKTQKEINAMEEEAANLKAWKDEWEAHRAELAEPELPTTFKAKPLWKQIITTNPFSKTASLEETLRAERKDYLSRVLRPESDGQVDVGAAIADDELSKKAYAEKLMNEMSDQRREMRQELLQATREKISNTDFKNKVAKATKEFKGISNAKLLVDECAKANIPYGPQITGPEKLTKEAAIEALVIHRHMKDAENKRIIAEQQERLKEADAFRKKLADMESRHMQTGKKSKKKAKAK